MPICKLCEREQNLCNSHIVAEFLWQDMYNSKHQVLGIHGEGRKGWDILQKGIREKLLCNDCEQHINEHFEKPFKEAWIDNCPLPDPWQKEETLWIDVDYASFKLFHLSVLYRAHISSLPTFIEVDLGPHAEKLRNMLLNVTPGKESEYPIFAYGIVHHVSFRPVQMISYVQRSKFNGHRCYGIMYGGMEWWICVSSHKNMEFLKGALRETGRMPTFPMPMNQVGAIQEVQKALKNAGT